MPPLDDRHPSTVSDWDDARRRARLRRTRLGHQWKTLRRTRLALLRVAVLLMIVLVAFAQYWTHDVAPERARLARTEPALLPVAEPVDPRDGDTAVVDMVGLGGLNASDTAASLTSLRELGEVWAIRYDNQGIDTKVIADLIVRSAVMSGVRDIVLVGHSMGGVIALEVAHHIHTGSDRRLAGVLLDCTPLDLDAVRPASRSLGEDMVRWMSWLPGARESRGLRFVVETYARRDRYLDRSGVPGIRFGRLGEAMEEVLRDKIFNPDAASNGLIEAQFLAIVAAGASDDLRTLSRPARGKPSPAIVFIRPRNPVRDRVVDVERSHRVLIDEVGGVDGTLLVVRPRHTGHANPRQRPVAYNQVIERSVVPFVQRYQERIRDMARAAGSPLLIEPGG
ncbi:alpha/beta fold hydrolase [Nocardia donostiensis]|uniref:Alpha/beta hydrolase n=1 Tax=Nocardia donostiensis TaxID=1538463 RepID=A0A1V2TBH9_9NOCA|nr:alpha/beta hydrolase [Nocardia donostiensis]ONM46857.1 alpha/beta hydrolase [Nocardia donostiensis]OQS19116.1 alpha/beta hydrolase [Nocardia donostiensis]